MGLHLESYVGGDVVAPLDRRGRSEIYSAESILSRHRSNFKDALCRIASLILVRDCFIHLSFEAIFAALRNITRSKIRYLLTTHFADAAANLDIETGSYHTVNLCAPPFNFPPALELID